MRHGVNEVLAGLICLAAIPAASRAQEKPPSPAEELQALVREYGRASGEFRRAGTDEERKAAVEGLDRFPRKFVELAERHAADRLAVNVLVEAVRAMNAADSLTQTTWEMNAASFPVPAKDDAAERAVALLRRGHLRSAELGLLCQRMTYGVRREYETFLREVLKENPHREVQGLACLALAGFLRSRLEKLDLARDRTELAPRYRELFGRDHFQELERQGRAGLAREVEALFQRAATDFGEVKHPYEGTVGEVARGDLQEIRHLAAGKPAPDIEGRDQDCVAFKLSDHRGKVVLLDFWQEY